MVYYGSSKLTKPVVELKNAAIKISNGDYRLVIDNKSYYEIGDLVRAFNEMAKQLLSHSEQIKQDNLLRMQSIIDTQEQERQRLSRDLHDGLAQMLLAIKLKMDQIVIHEDSKHQKHLQEAKELLKNEISEIWCYFGGFNTCFTFELWIGRRDKKVMPCHNPVNKHQNESDLRQFRQSLAG